VSHEPIARLQPKPCEGWFCTLQQRQMHESMSWHCHCPHNSVADWVLLHFESWVGSSIDHAEADGRGLRNQWQPWKKQKSTSPPVWNWGCVSHPNSLGVWFFHSERNRNRSEARETENDKLLGEVISISLAARRALRCCRRNMTHWRGRLLPRLTKFWPLICFRTTQNCVCCKISTQNSVSFWNLVSKSGPSHSKPVLFFPGLRKRALNEWQVSSGLGIDNFKQHVECQLIGFLTVWNQSAFSKKSVQTGLKTGLII